MNQESPKKSQRARPISMSRVPSKLRESSLASYAEGDGDINMSVGSRDSSPEDDGMNDSAPPSTVSRSPLVGRKGASPEASQASFKADYLNGRLSIPYMLLDMYLIHHTNRRGRRRNRLGD
jgi:hypothetical protein